MVLDDEPCTIGICGERDTLNINQSDQIKELQRARFAPSEIAERGDVNRKTVNKYMIIVDYRPTLENQKVEKSKFARLIQAR